MIIINNHLNKKKNENEKQQQQQQRRLILKCQCNVDRKKLYYGLIIDLYYAAKDDIKDAKCKCMNRI